MDWPLASTPGRQRAPDRNETPEIAREMSSAIRPGGEPEGDYGRSVAGGTQTVFFNRFAVVFVEI